MITNQLLQELFTQLEITGFEGDLNVAGILKGQFLAFIPLLKHALSFSPHVSRILTAKGYDLENASEIELTVAAFVISKRVFGSVPPLSIEHFLEGGSEALSAKLLFILRLLYYVKTVQYQKGDGIIQTLCKVVYNVYIRLGTCENVAASKPSGTPLICSFCISVSLFGSTQESIRLPPAEVLSFDEELIFEWKPSRGLPLDRISDALEGQRASIALLQVFSQDGTDDSRVAIAKWEGDARELVLDTKGTPVVNHTKAIPLRRYIREAPSSSTIKLELAITALVLESKLSGEQPKQQRVSFAPTHATPSDSPPQPEPAHPADPQLSSKSGTSYAAAMPGDTPASSDHNSEVDDKWIDEEFASDSPRQNPRDTKIFPVNDYVANFDWPQQIVGDQQRFATVPPDERKPVVVIYDSPHVRVNVDIAGVENAKKPGSAPITTGKSSKQPRRSNIEPRPTKTPLAREAHTRNALARTAELQTTSLTKPSQCSRRASEGDKNDAFSDDQLRSALPLQPPVATSPSGRSVLRSADSHPPTKLATERSATALRQQRLLDQLNSKVDELVSDVRRIEEHLTSHTDTSTQTKSAAATQTPIDSGIIPLYTFQRRSTTEHRTPMRLVIPRTFDVPPAYNAEGSLRAEFEKALKREQARRRQTQVEDMLVDERLKQLGLEAYRSGSVGRFHGEMPFASYADYLQNKPNPNYKG